MSETTTPPDVTDQAISAEDAAALPAPIDTLAEAAGSVPDPVEPADPTARPWHNAENPLEALWTHFTAEIAALKEKLG